MALVYLATNLANGKQYVGMSRLTLARRKTAHRRRAASGERGCPRFYDAIRKYGFAQFSWEQLSEHDTEEQAALEEIRVIAMLHPEYNVLPGGNRGPINPVNKRKVICLDDGLVHESLSATARFYGTSSSVICWVCKGKGVTAAGGRHFQYFSTQIDAEDRRKLIRDIDSTAAMKRKWVNRPQKWREDQMVRLRATGTPSSSGVNDGRDCLGRRASGPLRNARPVVCLDDGKFYESASAAARFYGVSKSAIIELCLGKNSRRAVSGKHFQYRNE